MIHLISSFYLPKNKEREQELLKTVKMNITCPYISQVHLFFDDEKSKEYLKKNIGENIFQEKIKIINIQSQPSYAELFKYANTLKNQICMVTNGDIWIKYIKNRFYIEYLKNKKLIYALTRHEHDLTSRLIDNFNGSHDAFIFQSPVPDILTTYPTFPQNYWGSENVICNLFLKSGYRGYNICKDIVIIHEHKYMGRNMNGPHVYDYFKDKKQGIYISCTGCIPCFIDIVTTPSLQNIKTMKVKFLPLKPDKNQQVTNGLFKINLNPFR
jgi:hypothetical protein